mgnify:FL=1
MTNKEKYARMIDHTNLHADATDADMKKLCDEARENHFRMVAINPAQVKRCKEFLKDTDVHVGAAIAFPLGQETLATKVYSVKDAIENGADEIDYVINITELKEGNYSYIEEEMRRIAEICRESYVISNVIFENCYLTKEEIKIVAQIAKKVKPDFIKTSTGFGPSGAKVEDVALMKSVVGDDVLVKAAGGIRTYEQFMEMVNAGASRIGTSNSLKIVEHIPD